MRMLFHLSLCYAGLDAGRTFFFYHSPHELALLSLWGLYPSLGHSTDQENHPSSRCPSTSIMAAILPRSTQALTKGAQTGSKLSSKLAQRQKTSGANCLSCQKGLSDPLAKSCHDLQVLSSLLSAYSMKHVQSKREIQTQVLMNLGTVFLHILPSLQQNKHREILTQILPLWLLCLGTESWICYS